MAKIDLENKKAEKLVGIMIIIANVLFLSLLSAVISLVILYNDTIYNNIYVESIDVSGLTVIEAANKVEEELRESNLQNELILRHKEKTWSFDPKDVELKYDFRKAINEAYFIGRKGNYIHRLSRIIELFKEPEDISIKSSINMYKVNEILKSLEKEINIMPIDATMIRKEGRFIIKEGNKGYVLDKEATSLKIQETIMNMSYFKPVEIDLIVNEITPKTTSEMLGNIQDLLGGYSTKFNSSITGRSYNIALSAKSIDGTLLLPEEIFSFNEIVGPRTTSNGYRVAPVIFEGEIVDGIGGGVCQVSSTIYNSVLKSELEIVERTNHSIPSTYVPKGLDATVSYGVLDFKFKNSTDYPIYLESFIRGNEIFVNLYGKKNINREVRFKSVVNSIIKRDTEVVHDPDMYEGEEIVRKKGRNGYKVATYKIIYENGKKVSEEKITSDYYRPSKRVIVRGVKKQNELKTRDGIEN